jgi:hypothetical protein
MSFGDSRIIDTVDEIDPDAHAALKRHLMEHPDSTRQQIASALGFSGQMVEKWLEWSYRAGWLIREGQPPTPHFRIRPIDE